MPAHNEPVVVTLHVLGGDRASAVRGLCAALPGSEVAWAHSASGRTDLELLVDLVPDRIHGALWLAADRIGWDLEVSADAAVFTATPRITVTAPGTVAEVDTLAIA